MSRVVFVPEPDFLILCRVGIEQENMFSLLGAGVTSFTSHQLPMNPTVTVAGRFYWRPEELGAAHVVAVRVEREEDGERLVDVTNPVQLSPPELEGAQHVSRAARQMNILLDIPLNLRRPGTCVVKIVVDAKTIMESYFEVDTLMPPV